MGYLVGFWFLSDCNFFIYFFWRKITFFFEFLVIFFFYLEKFILDFMGEIFMI